MTQYTIYVDLDGVVADFEGFYLQQFGHSFRSVSKNQLWKNVNKYRDKQGSWYRDLPLKPDAMILWNYLLPYTPKVLTATGVVSMEIQYDKISWGKENLPGDPEIITVTNGVLKAQYATPTSVLIDDTAKVIDSWVKAGGIGILHTDAMSTIQKLKELGL